MAIRVGDKAPQFTLHDSEKKLRSWTEFMGKTTVLAFFPGAFTGVCTKEMCTFRDSMTKLVGMNAQVVGISVDSPFANKAFAAHNNIPFPLLSDFTRDVSRQYGGLNDNFSGINGYSAAKRSVFVVDKSGVVRYAWVSDNPGIEPNYEEVSTAVAAVQ